MLIESKENKIIKYLLSLKKPKYREREKKFLIEGIKQIEEYFSYGIVESVIYTEKIFRNKNAEEILKKIKEKKIKTIQTTEKIIKILSSTTTPQGIIGVVNKKFYKLEDIKLNRENLLVILEGIQDPGNLGTIIRTSLAIKVSGLILLEGCVDLYNPKVLRSAAVYIYNLPIIKLNDLENLFFYLKKNNFKIVLTDPHSEKNCFEIKYPERTALVFGNEARGISEIWAKEKFISVKIPILGNVESLNVAIAFSIIGYEILRQQRYLF
jgi:TrmH family RNA methyltransferase